MIPYLHNNKRAVMGLGPLNLSLNAYTYECGACLTPKNAAAYDPLVYVCSVCHPMPLLTVGYRDNYTRRVAGLSTISFDFGTRKWFCNTCICDLCSLDDFYNDKVDLSIVACVVCAANAMSPTPQFLPDPTPVASVKCECGAASIGVKPYMVGHSSWCVVAG